MLHLHVYLGFEDGFDFLYGGSFRYVQGDSLSFGSGRDGDEAEDMVGNDGLVGDEVVRICLDLLKRCFIWD